MMQNMIWIVTHRKEQFFSSASAQSSPKLQKDDGRYPNRVAFLITNCNLFVSISEKKTTPCRVISSNQSMQGDQSEPLSWDIGLPATK